MINVKCKGILTHTRWRQEISLIHVSLAMDQTTRRHIFYNDEKTAVTGYSLKIGVSIPGRSIIYIYIFFFFFCKNRLGGCVNSNVKSKAKLIYDSINLNGFSAKIRTHW